MSTRIRCEGCGRTYAVSGALEGRSFRMRCKGCGAAIQVLPERPPAPPEPARLADTFEIVLEEPVRRSPGEPPRSGRHSAPRFLVELPAAPRGARDPAQEATPRAEPLPPEGDLAGLAHVPESRRPRRSGSGRARMLAAAVFAATLAAGLLLLKGRPAAVDGPAVQSGPVPAPARPAGGAVPSRTVAPAQP
jgi:hypothetical protein